MNESNAIVVSECDAITHTPTGGALRPADVVAQVQRVQEVMQAVMKDGEHYGKIPGCGDKPALMQPGAQVLAFTFRLAPTFDIDTKDLSNGHREYVVCCNLVSINSGQLVGTGVGSCSTMESKYRYRNVSDYEITDQEIPADAKERKAEYRRQGFGMKKVDGVWSWVKYKDSGRVENPDIADTYNTVLKMATKRAFVHATLNATAASDMFTQDVEDLPKESEPIANPAGLIELVDESTLKKLRGLRAALEVSDEDYGKALAYYDAPADDQLPSKAAHELIAVYDRRVKAKAAYDDEEIPF